MINYDDMEGNRADPRIRRDEVEDGRNRKDQEGS